MRARLPKRRENVTYTLVLDGKKIHVTLGLYPDGKVGEIFVAVAKVGAYTRTAIETWAMAVSHALQHGMSVRDVVLAFRGTRADEGTVDCDAVPSIDRRRFASTWDALCGLLEAVTDDDGRLRNEAAPPQGRPEGRRT